MRFKSKKQQAAVMSKLQRFGIKGKPKAMEITKNMIRVRMQNPKNFQRNSFRTIDPGRKGVGPKLVIARPKGKMTTQTQAVLVPKKEW